MKIGGFERSDPLLCDLKEELVDELDLLWDVFIWNGYPRRFVDRTINGLCRKEQEKEMKKLQIEQQGEQKDNDSEYYDVLHAPCIASF